MEGIESANLILQVQKHACLYNMSMQSYRDRSLGCKSLKDGAKRNDVKNVVFFAYCFELQMV